MRGQDMGQTERKRRVRGWLPGILAVCMVLCIVLGIRTGVQAAPAADAATQRTVYLAAATAGKMVIEPEGHIYTEGQTVKEFLASAGHEFEGLENGWISAIDGVTGNYSIFYDGGRYELDAVPETFTVICFSEAEDVYSEEMIGLISSMGQYREREDYESLNRFTPAREAYEKAQKGLQKGAGKEEAQELKAALDQAVSEYDGIYQGPKYEVGFLAEQGDEYLKQLSIRMTDAYGNRTEGTGTTISVVAGTYTFSVSDGGANRAEGTVSIDAEHAGQTVKVTLPSGEWFGDVQLLDAGKNAYALEQDAEAHRTVYQIPDTVGSTGLYLYAAYADVPDKDEAKTKTTLRTIYTGTDGVDKSTISRSWNSQNTALAFCLAQGMDGRTIKLEAGYEMSGDTGSYTMIQSYDLVLERFPTLKELSVKDGETELLADFQSQQETYTLTTTADTLTITGTPFWTDGCQVLVNGEDTATVAVDRKNVTAEVSVTWKGKKTTTYRLNITKADPVQVDLKIPSGTTVRVENEAGSEVPPVSGTRYELIPGQTYTYITTAGEYYHASAAFQAADGLTVEAAKPDTTDAMTAFALYDGSRAGKRLAYELEPVYKKAVHQYECTVPDTSTTAYVQATKTGTYKAYASYVSQVTGQTITKEVTYVYSETGGCLALGQLVTASGYSQDLQVRLSKTSDTDSSVTLYQDYEFHIRRTEHLKTLSVSGTDGALVLADEDGNPTAFTRDQLEYWITLAKGTEEIRMQASFTNEDQTSAYGGGYYALVDGTRYDSLKNVTIPFEENDRNWTKRDIVIEVCHKDQSNLPQSYVLHLEQKDPVAVTFKTTPADARVFVKNKGNGQTVQPVDGVYSLIPSMSYSYQVTCNGYVGQQVTEYQAPAKSTEVKVELQKAAENTSLVDLDAPWPTFRYDENNNGVVKAAVPRTSDEAVMYWSTKLGDGFSSNATGCPILVGDYIYTYGADSLYKVDKLTGEIKAQAKMDHTSSFGINNPVYADGMIFVGLSDGCIQAFNADTLKSLWIYHDELGGQPNCPIICKDGYLYTGFWLGEESKANFICLSMTDEDPSKEKEEKLASWTYTQKGGFYWAGAYVDDDFLLVGTDDGESGYLKGYGNLLSLDPETGALIDQVKMPYRGDVRSSVTREEGTDHYYFTSKGGYFYGVQVASDGKIKDSSLQALKLDNYANDDDAPAMSTSTPTVYNGRAYVGVSGTSQFGAYSGHNITVIDLKSWEIAYKVRTMGYPQTSGLLTTAYEASEGTAYIYFFDNYTPGMLRVITDKPGQKKPSQTITEIYDNQGTKTEYQTAPILFTPDGAEAQYAICSPIVDQEGTIYFKNDSAYLMAVGNTIDHLEVTEMPDKTVYRTGDIFDPTGMKVTAHYTNGTVRDITSAVSYKKTALSGTDQNFTLIFTHVRYQDKNGQTGVPYEEPTVDLSLTVITLGDLNDDGVIDIEDGKLASQIANGDLTPSDRQSSSGDVNGDGAIDSMDVTLIYAYINGKIYSFPFQQ